MRALTLKGNIDEYLRGIADRAEKAQAERELAAFYKHVTGICCLAPKPNDRGGCANCGDTWRLR